MKIIKIANRLVTSYFAVWVILVSLISFTFPSVFDGLDFIIVPALGLVMLCMGITLETADFIRVMERPYDVSVGIICQYLFMPLAGFIIAAFLGVDPLIATGVVLLGSCPGGTASNVITFLSRGDLALSVTMTLFSTMISPVLIPLSMYIYAGQWIDVPVTKLFISSFQIVVIPIFTGVVLGRIMGSWKKSILPFMPSLSTAGIVLIIAVIVALNSDSLVSVGLKLVLIVVIHNSIGLLIGYRIARAVGMDRTRARTVSIEVGMQNSGLGVVLASLNFGPLAALPSALFSIWHNVSGSILAHFWSRDGLSGN